jgi:hypothetical protein
MYATIWITALTQPLLAHDGIAGALAICAFAAMRFILVSSESHDVRRGRKSLRHISRTHMAAYAALTQSHNNLR